MKDSVNDPLLKTVQFSNHWKRGKSRKSINQ
ncbi:hypothetical protein P872_07280 [Rhodonellum psychrophilum GCM71 = DSM 17998]|uniref:Uncharacterized protein n=1 Tax=Rhodonellum psychrophilum GCM71 = DSM 17998 TaxID=1123057 RepID=U5BZU3_9BACT|nr:hypothetical protein P872_07280 [Rhodonellum psychrophilum GCM71 = DSM 17998]